MVYLPAEDSFLLAEEVEKYISKLTDKKIDVLDMGSGSGIQAQAAMEAGVHKKHVFCADIDKEVIEHLKKQKFNAVHSNLFEQIDNSFDLIIFNAPYLPEDKYDKKPDTTAGKRGNETILEFLKQAKSHLNKEGIILLLFSNLSKPAEILKLAEKLGYKSEKLVEKSVGMMEDLFVYKFNIS
jgi:release factor glutamine methyltransferase